MAWFKRKEKITTATEDKMDVKVFGISLLQEKLLMLMSWGNLFVSQKMVFMLELVVVPILRFYLTTMSLLN
jgi:hypothetical protein